MYLVSLLPCRAPALCAAIAIATSSSLAPAFAADAIVTMSNFAFVPAETTIAVGSKVTFKNGDDMVHSLVADDASFHSGALDTNDEYAFTFTRAGVFSFHCGLHPYMQGKIIVK